MEKQNLYLAYGSNMNSRDMNRRCPDAKLIGRTCLNGYKLEFRFYANIVPELNGKVPAVLWAITKSHEAVLDEYEEIKKGIYKKEKINIHLNGQKNVLVYTMNQDLSPIQPPEQAYYRVIEEAYREHGFDLSILLQACSQIKEKG